MLLAMLFSFPEFTVDQIALRSNICHYRRIAVTSLISSGDTLLFGLGIIKGRDINIHGHITVREFSRYNAIIPEHLDVFRKDIRTHG